MQDKTSDKNISSLTKISTKICVLALILFTSQAIVFSQVKEKNNKSTSNQETEDESNIPSIGPANCESLRRDVEIYILEKIKLGEGSKIIIVLRLNKRESADYYNIRRKGLIFWFENYFPKKYVFAKGDVIDSQDDMGRADIYVNGKKSFIIFFKIRNRKICEGGNPG